MTSGLEAFKYFVAERQRIWHRRYVLLQPPSWTDDEVLRNYRFTNLQRELDRGTRYLTDMLSAHESDSLELRAVNTMLYRWLNRWEVWDLDVKWIRSSADIDAAFMRLDARKARGEAVLTAAWTSPTFGASKIPGTTTLEMLKRSALETWQSSVVHSSSVQEMYAQVLQFKGVGPFIGWQMTLDLVMMRPDLNDDTWVPDPYAGSSPGRSGTGGSGAGAAIVMPGVPARDVIYQLRESRELWLPADWDDVAWKLKPQLSLADIEHALCEFRKWCNIRENPQKFKRAFKPSALEMKW